MKWIATLLEMQCNSRGAYLVVFQWCLGGVDYICLSPPPKLDFSPNFLLIHMYKILIYKR
jgi:hypothetical protein